MTIIHGEWIKQTNIVESTDINILLQIYHVLQNVGGQTFFSFRTLVHPYVPRIHKRQKNHCSSIQRNQSINLNLLSK